jgi:hypothetical protein
VHRDAAPERLRREVDAGAKEPAGLTLDRLVLEVLVRGRSTIRVSPSLPRSTIWGGVGADTIASSCGQATRSSWRRST